MNIEIIDQPQSQRYELRVDGELASVVEYVRTGDRVVFPHTETFPNFQGQGLAERLVLHALDDARRRGLVVVPLCWFVAQVVGEHPEYAPLLSAR